MVLLSKKITSPARAYIAIASLFLLGFLLILVGARAGSSYLMGVGITICGICDCAGLSVSVNLAGNWLEAGMTASLLGQSISVAVCSMVMVFVDIEWSSVLIGASYVYCVACLYMHSQKS